MTTSPDTKTTPETLPESPEVSTDNPKIYRSTPLTFGIGKFRFDKHQLKLVTQADVDELEALLDGLSPIDRTQVVTVDVDAANRLALQHQRSAAHRGGMHSGVKPVSTDTINMQNAEEMQRAGMSQEQIEAAKIAADGSDAGNGMPVVDVNTAGMDGPDPAAANEASTPVSATAAPKPAAPAGSLAALAGVSK